MPGECADGLLFRSAIGIVTDSDGLKTCVFLVGDVCLVA